VSGVLLLVACAQAADPVDFPCSDVTEIPQIECEALVALYNVAGGPGWEERTAGWLAFDRSI